MGDLVVCVGGGFSVEIIMYCLNVPLILKCLQLIIRVVTHEMVISKRSTLALPEKVLFNLNVIVFLSKKPKEMILTSLLRKVIETLHSWKWSRS